MHKLYRSFYDYIYVQKNIVLVVCIIKYSEKKISSPFTSDRMYLYCVILNATFLSINNELFYIFDI